jgi:hypothetical protein
MLMSSCLAYLKALQQTGPEDFDRLLFDRLNDTLDEYIEALREGIS